MPDAAPQQSAADPLRELLASMDPDAMSPREAQAALYRLKELG
jgi:DNA mismatch repair protein MutS